MYALIIIVFTAAGVASPKGTTVPIYPTAAACQASKPTALAFVQGEMYGKPEY
jgi:hypothetical protein